ncbi:MAG: hypothetical protein NT062_20465, partial [Proteobacteria bacterium]|nr:hypothetical protein [Pseudomonadota bacterium]
GKHLADEILRWPPQVAWTDPVEQARFARLFARDTPGPSLPALALGIQLARWELQRDVDQVSYALRNGAPEALGDEVGALAARFLWRWLPEWLYELNERAGSRLPRVQLLRALEQAELRIHAARTTLIGG